MFGSSHATKNPPGFVPINGQGLRAKESQLGAIGTKQWLKSIKLHKYWPLISHWSYWQMLSLTEDNFDYHVKWVGATGITRGAQRKLLKEVRGLRVREASLHNLIEDLLSGNASLNEALSCVRKVLHTPMPTSEEELLPTVVVQLTLKVLEFTKTTRISSYELEKMEKIIWDIKNNRVLNRAQQRLKYLTKAGQITSTSKKDIGTTSSSTVDVLPNRKRNFSEDSGFEQKMCDDYLPSTEFTLIWPVGTNTVMFNLHSTTEYHDLLQHSPFYTSAHTSGNDIFEIEENLCEIINNLLK